MASDMHILAVSLIKQGEKSTREINQETGYAIKYLEQLKSELKHPGAIKRARDRYNARHPGLTVARTREWRSQHPSERNRRRRENYRVTANARNDHQTWLPIHLEKITAPERPSDRELAKELGRSVQAIQNMRYRLVK